MVTSELPPNSKDSGHWLLSPSSAVTCAKWLLASMISAVDGLIAIACRAPPIPFDPAACDFPLL